MLDREFLAERLLLLERFFRELQDLAHLDRDSFLSSSRNTATAESFLRRALETIFDIGRHTLARSGYLDLSTECKSIARGLEKMGIVDHNLGEKLLQMAGYRNRLVHLYNPVSDEELYEILREDLKDIEGFISAVKGLLEGQH